MNNRNLDILFVLVLYKCKIQDSNTFITLIDSLKSCNYNSDFLIYDNSPDFNFNYKLDDVRNCNIIYQADLDNSGVSKSYNLGAHIAAKMNKKWILLLDQDTIFPVQTINQYLLSIESYPGDKLFAPIMMANHNRIISPCYFKFMRGFALKSINTGIQDLNNYSIINCGMCVALDAFNKNEGYNELIKLDFSDHDFIKRFKKAIGERFIVIDLRVHHQLSSESKNSLNNDLVRFSYYLEGANHMNSSIGEKMLLRFNAALRALKLSLIHKNIVFLFQLWKWI